MTAPPKRREVRRAHLDAAAVPMERALIARAGALEEARATFGDDFPGGEVYVTLAAEFRLLAEEIHWWG